MERKELLGVTAILLLVGIVVYGPHVADGGFYADDWADSAAYRFEGYWSSVADHIDFLGGRPGLALLHPAPHALFGTQPELHLGLALALGIATSLCLYLLLRTLSLAPLHAGAIAVLSLLFPGSDVIRLWATGGINNVSVCFYLLGLVLALRGLERRGRASTAMHAGADALYVASVLVYEATGAAALLSGLLYMGRAPFARAARRWLADIAVVLAALGYSLAATVDERHVGSLTERLGDIPEFIRQAAQLLARSLLPVASLGRVVTGVVLLLAAVIVGLALARARRQPQSPLRDWLRLIAMAVGGIGAAYFMFLGTGLSPDDQGVDMRINVFAGLAYCVLVYAIVATGSNLVLRSRSAATAATLVVATAIAIGYGIRVRDDAAEWRRATTLQNQLLRALDRELLPLPPASTLLSFDFPSQAAPEVPVFDKPWDLRGAVGIRADDRSIRTFPIFTGITARCERSGVVVEGAGSYGTFRIEYERVFFLDARQGQGRRIRTARDCEAALRTFRPGPLRAGPQL